MIFKDAWPFKNLQVGESCTIGPDRAARAKTYCHVYAAQSGKRMTWKGSKDGSIIVTRLTDRADLNIELSEAEVNAINTLFPDKARLRKFCQIMAGKTRVLNLPDGGLRLEKRDE